jgi:hypothetical protein
MQPFASQLKQAGIEAVCFRAVNAGASMRRLQRASSSDVRAAVKRERRDLGAWKLLAALASS